VPARDDQEPTARAILSADVELSARPCRLKGLDHSGGRIVGADIK
jgi:hypothetical protein